MALSQKNVQRGNKKMVTIKEIAKECDLIERLIAFLEAGNLAKNAMSLSQQYQIS